MCEDSYEDTFEDTQNENPFCFWTYCPFSGKFRSSPNNLRKSCLSRTLPSPRGCHWWAPVVLPFCQKRRSASEDNAVCQTWESMVLPIEKEPLWAKALALRLWHWKAPTSLVRTPAFSNILGYALWVSCPKPLWRIHCSFFLIFIHACTNCVYEVYRATPLQYILTNYYVCTPLKLPYSTLQYIGWRYLTVHYISLHCYIILQITYYISHMAYRAWLITYNISWHYISHIAYFMWHITYSCITLHIRLHFSIKLHHITLHSFLYVCMSDLAFISSFMQIFRSRISSTHLCKEVPPAVQTRKKAKQDLSNPQENTSQAVNETLFSMP